MTLRSTNLKISRLLTLIAFLAILAMATHMAIDEDTWWHLAAGRLMVAERSLITTDPFSYTSGGEPWRYPGQWVQIVMFLVFDQFGPGGINLWVSLMVLAIFIIVWKTMTGKNLLVNLSVLLLAAAASAIYWAARPYLITYLLAAGYFFLLRRWYTEKKGPLWLLPILMVLWVNSHGGYLAGFLLLAPFLLEAFLDWLSARRQSGTSAEAGARLVHLIQVSGLSLAATLLNPNGYRLWTLPFTTVKRVTEQLFIQEWQSPDFHNPFLLPFLGLIALTLFSAGVSKQKPSLHLALLLAGFGAMGLYSIRNIFFFVIVAPAALSFTMEAFWLEWKEQLKLDLDLDFDRPPNRIQSITNWVLLGAVALFTLLRVYAFLPSNANQDIITQQFPVAAVEYLQQSQPEGRLFNAYNFGGYCIWALPEYPVFVDGRADLHGDEIILEWYRTVNLVGDWQAVLDGWDVGVVLLEPNQPLVAELTEQGWQVGYHDGLAVVLLKD